METLITFKTAKLAKDKGFDIYQKNVYVETLEHTLEMGRGGDCTFPAHEPRILKNRGFDKWHIIHCQAPSQSVLQKWLREEYNIDVLINKTISGVYMYIIWKGSEKIERKGRFYNYEKCLEIGFQEALNLI